MQKTDPLAELLEDGVIDAVHTRLMSGKEATVFVVERGGHLGAAKVYKERNDRTFKKVASYIEGRNQTRNTRDRRAMEKKSGYGRELMEEGWQDMEFRALRKAFDAGVRVPEPYFVFPNVLLMELVVDNQGAPASRLADFPYTPEQATLLHFEVFMQVKALLAVGLIHGDLSAYNVLMANAGPTIIDLPQVIDAAANTNAHAILRRDLRNITEHLTRFDARLQRFADCGDALFKHYQAGTLDMVGGPEESAPQWRGGAGGRRGRDAERGRAGREKGGRADVARPESPQGFREAPRVEGQQRPQNQDGQRQPRMDGQRQPRQDGPRPPHQDGPRPPRQDARRAPRQDGPRPPRQEASRGNGQRGNGDYSDNGPRRAAPIDVSGAERGPNRNGGNGPIIEERVRRVREPSPSQTRRPDAGGTDSRGPAPEQRYRPRGRP